MGGRAAGHNDSNAGPHTPTAPWALHVLVFSAVIYLAAVVNFMNTDFSAIS